jgi:hypothetical protein
MMNDSRYADKFQRFFLGLSKKTATRSASRWASTSLDMKQEEVWKLFRATSG